MGSVEHLIDNDGMACWHEQNPLLIGAPNMDAGLIQQSPDMTDPGRIPATPSFHKRQIVVILSFSSKICQIRMDVFQVTLSDFAPCWTYIQHPTATTGRSPFTGPTGAQI